MYRQVEKSVKSPTKSVQRTRGSWCGYGSEQVEEGKHNLKSASCVSSREGTSAALGLQDLGPGLMLGYVPWR